VQSSERLRQGCSRIALTSRQRSELRSPVVHAEWSMLASRRNVRRAPADYCLQHGGVTGFGEGQMAPFCNGEPPRWSDIVDCLLLLALAVHHCVCRDAPKHSCPSPQATLGDGVHNVTGRAQAAFCPVALDAVQRLLVLVLWHVLSLRSPTHQ
jgi:hypothetical protein